MRSFYIDYSNKKLYLIPPSGYTIQDVDIKLAYTTFGTQVQGVFYGNSTSLNLTFERINFDGFRSRIFSDGIGGTKFYRCIFKNANDYFINGTENDNSNTEIRMCKFGYGNSEAIHLTAGNRTTLTSGNVKIYNCIFSELGFNNFMSAYRPSIEIHGVGFEVQGNKIYLSPGLGILFRGNNNVFNNNIFEYQAYEAGDSGALYSGRDWTFRGNEITNNIFRAGIFQDTNGMNSATYLDDCFSSANVKENTYYNYQVGIQMGRGRDNIITGNKMIGCAIGISADARGTNMSDSDFSELRNNMLAVPYNKAPYTTEYPAISTLNNASFNIKSQNGVPYGNTIQNNIATECNEDYNIEAPVITNGRVNNNTSN